MERVSFGPYKNGLLSDLLDDEAYCRWMYRHLTRWNEYGHLIVERYPHFDQQLPFPDANVDEIITRFTHKDLLLIDSILPPCDYVMSDQPNAYFPNALYLDGVVYRSFLHLLTRKLIVDAAKETFVDESVSLDHLDLYAHVQDRIWSDCLYELLLLTNHHDLPDRDQFVSSLLRLETTESRFFDRYFSYWKEATSGQDVRIVTNRKELITDPIIVIGSRVYLVVASSKEFDPYWHYRVMALAAVAIRTDIPISHAVILNPMRAEEYVLPITDWNASNYIDFLTNRLDRS